MSTFFEANQARYGLKMKLVNYHWFRNAVVITSDDGYDVLITTSKIDNTIRKTIPQVVNGVGVKVEIE